MPSWINEDTLTAATLDVASDSVRDAGDDSGVTCIGKIVCRTYSRTFSQVVVHLPI